MHSDFAPSASCQVPATCNWPWLCTWPQGAADWDTEAEWEWVGTERPSREVWENKGHILAGESSDLQVYNPEVALLEREVIPGRVGYRAGAGRQQWGGIWALERKPRPSDFASVSPGTATHGTCTNLGKLRMFEFPSPHPFHRNFLKKCKRQWPNPSHWAALWFHIWIFSQLQGGNLSICPNILTELQEKLSKTVEDTGRWRSLKMVSVARLWVPI